MEQNLATMTEISSTTTTRTTTLTKQDMKKRTRIIACSRAATTNVKQEFKSDEIMVDNGDDKLLANIMDKQLNWDTVTRLTSLLVHFFGISSMVVVDAQSEDDSLEQSTKCLNRFSKELALIISVGYASVSLSALFGVSIYSFVSMEKDGMYLLLLFYYCCSNTSMFCLKC